MDSFIISDFLIKKVKIKNILHIIKSNHMEKKMNNYLMLFGGVNDLSEKAKKGLLVHLYAWCYIQNQEEKGINFELNWYQKDKLADKIAIDWNYEEEVEELRKIRPLKVSGFEPLTKPVFLSEYSIPNKEFYDNLILFFNKKNKDIQNKIINEYFFFYKDQFSVALKTSLIPHDKQLVIITQPNNFESKLQKVITQEF